MSAPSLSRFKVYLRTTATIVCVVEAENAEAAAADALELHDESGDQHFEYKQWDLVVSSVDKIS